MATYLVVSVEELNSKSSEDLVQFLKTHRRSDGVCQLNVLDFDLLSPQQKFLIYVKLVIHKVSADLEQHVSPDPGRKATFGVVLIMASPRGNLPEIRAQMPQEFPGGGYLPTSEEIDNHRDLVNQDCRPVYDVERVWEVMRHPDEHQNDLLPYSMFCPSRALPYMAFREQLGRWREFRNWQKDNRPIVDSVGDSDYKSYHDMVARDLQKIRDFQGYSRLLSEQDLAKEDFGTWQQLRAVGRQFVREQNRSDLDAYIAALRVTLDRHGIRSDSIDVHLDPKTQDKLTTWLEYICFETWWIKHFKERSMELKSDRDDCCRVISQRGYTLLVEEATETFADRMRNLFAQSAATESERQAMRNRVTGLAAETIRNNEFEPAPGLHAANGGQHGDGTVVVDKESEKRRILGDQSSRHNCDMLRTISMTIQDRDYLLVILLMCTAFYEAAVANASLYEKVVDWAKKETPTDAREVRADQTYGSVRRSRVTY